MLYLFGFLLLPLLLPASQLISPETLVCDITPSELEQATMQAKWMKALAVKTAKTTYPTGNKNFAVLQSFPSAFSETESDPFLMCDEFGPTLSTSKASDPDDFPSTCEPGFSPKLTKPVGWHPHRGMDIMTYIKAGIGRHADSMGNRGEFESPGMQWISVGSGIEHAEGGGTPVGEYEHGFQIWVNVPAEKKMDDPKYGTEPPQNLPLLKSPAHEARLLAGSVDGSNGPFKTVQDVQMVDFTIFPNSEHHHSVPETMDNCLVYVYKGEGKICGSLVPQGSVIRLDATNPQLRQVGFSTTEKGLSAILFAGKRLNEPVAWRGPIVMNTNAQVQSSYQEYYQGKFLRKRAAWDYKRIADFPADHVSH